MIEIQTKGKIKLEGENRIESPTITVISAADDYNQKKVSIWIRLKNESAQLGRDIGSFIYEETWTDEDVKAFVLDWVAKNTAK